jgi:hypothetical protein
VRLEDVQELAKLKEDAVACYQPVNSQELFAIERIAIAQQMILRGARVEAGLFTTAMNECLDPAGEPVHFLEPLMIGIDQPVEITRNQNRNFLAGEGFRRTARESNVWSLLLRYKAQAEREYRRAVEEFERLKALRPELLKQALPNEPITAAEPAEPEAVMSRSELNPNIDWNQVDATVAARNNAQERPASEMAPPETLPGAPRKSS